MIIRDGEQGEAQPIVLKSSDGTSYCSAWVVDADTTITFKPINDLTVTTLTITCTGFTKCASTVTWTPLATDLTTLGTDVDYRGYVNLNACACCRTAIARFCLTVEAV